MGRNQAEDSVTSREVCDALLRKRPAERVGLFEHGAWPETMAAWVQQGYPTRRVHKQAGEQRWSPVDGRSVPVEKEGDYPEPVPLWQRFGYDMVCTGGWFDVLPLRGCHEVIEETDEWEVYRNGAGAALKFWKHQCGTPGPVEYRMASRAIWERDYRPHLLSLDPARIAAADERRSLQEARDAQAWAFFGNQFIWENMRASLGDEAMYENLLLDPAWILDYGRVYTDFYRKHFAWMFEHVGMPDGIWIYEDLGYNCGLQASPQVLGELIFPYYQELVAFFHRHDLPVILHTDGWIADAIPLIIAAGFDGLNPIERKVPANDPFRYAEQYGDRLVFVGGLDERVLETNDKAVIRREVAGYIEGMKARGARLLFATDHTIAPAVRYESYCYSIEVYREHMSY